LDAASLSRAVQILDSDGRLSPPNFVYNWDINPNNTPPVSFTSAIPTPLTDSQMMVNLIAVTECLAQRNVDFSRMELAMHLSLQPKKEK
jgi:hypothetical protein